MNQAECVHACSPLFHWPSNQQALHYIFICGPIVLCPPPYNREDDRLKRIKDEGWDRFAPVSETNKP